MKLFDQFLHAEKDFFAYFSYYPQKNRYPERHPILDFRGFHWLLSKSDDNSLLIHWAPEPFTKADIEVGDSVYCEDVLEWLGANTNTGAKGGVWRGPEFTLVASGFRDGEERHYLLFSNSKECCSPVLAVCPDVIFVG